MAIEPMFPEVGFDLGRFIGCCAGADIWELDDQLFVQYGPGELDYTVLYPFGWKYPGDWQDDLGLTDAELNEKMAQVELFRSLFAPEAAA